MKKYIPLEKEEQRKLINYLDILKRQKKIIDFHSNPNENILSFLNRQMFIIAQQKFKYMGSKKGIPDIYVFTKEKLLAIELKRSKKSYSKVSKEQKEWIEKLNSLDFCKAKICYGADEAIQFINQYINQNYNDN